MPGLADAYGGDAERLQSRRRVKLGVGLLAAGTVLGFVSILIATTDLVAPVDSFDGRQIAGVLGGLGAPAILGGVATVLPANAKLRVAAGIGASITVLGVTMFWHAYPQHWAGYGDQLTPYVVGVYFLGMVVLSSCLFAGLVTLKRRNDPGGTVSLNVTTEERTTVIREEPTDPPAGAGGVGLLGGTPDGDVETQTNRETATKGQAGSNPRTRGRPTSDGGAVDDDLRTPSGPTHSDPSSGRTQSPPSTTTDAEVIEDTPDPAPDVADRYCGNCEQFQYVRTEQGMAPYCAAHDEIMDDMDPCEEWVPNN